MRQPRSILLALLLAACGSSPDGPAWAADYQARLDAEQATMTPAEITQLCTGLAGLSDDELRAQFGAQAGGDSVFDELMAERGEAPTVADYDAALDMAVAELRELCG